MSETEKNEILDSLRSQMTGELVKRRQLNMPSRKTVMRSQMPLQKWQCP